MTDEEQARDLLERATRLPDELTPPVRRLIMVGRRRRKLRTTQRTLAVGVIAVLAVVIPQAVRTTSGGTPSPNQPANSQPHGPTAAQIAKFTWSKLPPSPLGPRQQPLLTLAGRYVIELGGVHNGVAGHDGAVFDLKTRRWHKIAEAPGNVQFDQAVTVWTGHELFVTDGLTTDCAPGVPNATCLPHAGLYNPVTNRWTDTELPFVNRNLLPAAAVWTGRVVVVAVFNSHSSNTVAVGAYDPATGRWQVENPRLPAGHHPDLIQLVATSNRVVLWSQWAGKTGSNGLTHSGIDVLAFSDSDASPVAPWQNVTGKWPQGVEVGTPVFTGNSILLPPEKQWCSGHCITMIQANKGFFASQATLCRTATVPYSPGAALGVSFIWTGRAIIAASRILLRVDHLGVYDPATRTWRTLAPANARATVLPVWTGSELLVVTNQGTTLALHR
jgi:hypothetical protein